MALTAVTPGLVGAVIRFVTAAHHGRTTSARRSPAVASVTPSPDRTTPNLKPLGEIRTTAGSITPDLALAQAVREQLTRPGSVPAPRQFELIMAEKAFYSYPTGRHGGVLNRRWTPYLADVDPCPYREIADGSWQLTRPETSGSSR